MRDGFVPLVGPHEIRDMLGVSRQRVRQLALRSDFPRPVADLAQGKVWVLTDIETWISIHRAGRGRRAAARRHDST
ncbi:helix-turn-helix transcriptional regulator [Actinoplanes sp. CA-030573]|uniref:helix-turn-helix transcriptional regulator n=1 Tax=Actinoplanes sp. CA-030573 TaxID=3239898 RepID=UPI003D946061